jgi:hypothetical protein
MKYNSLGWEKDQVGKVKKVMVNRAGGCKDTFGKLGSNAIGDPFVDPGKYFLRGSRS